MKTRKARELSADALEGLKTLYDTEKLPSDEDKKKATLDVVKWVIEQRKLYTETFKGLTFAERDQSMPKLPRLSRQLRRT